MRAVQSRPAALWQIVWVTSLSELSATIVLYYGGMSTMPIESPLAIAQWVFRVKVDVTQ